MLSRAEFGALALAAQKDPALLMQECFWIATKGEPGQPPITRLALNVTQRRVHQAVLAQRRAGKPPRIIVLKCRQPGICLDPETRVLTADLRWVSLALLSPGDEVVAVDEDHGRSRGRGRKMSTAVVLAKAEVTEPAYRLRLGDGRELIATASHRFLSHKRGGTDTCWRRVSQTRPGDELRYVTTPWAAGDWEDAWFGGMLDGEGTLRHRSDFRSGTQVSVCQVAGPVYDRLLRYVRRQGHNFYIRVDDRSPGKSKLGSQVVYSVDVCRMNELFALMGRTRPTRFLGTRWWEGKDLPGKRSTAWVPVLSVEPLGTRRMVDLQTSTGTFLAEGVVSHNSTLGTGYMLATALCQPYSGSMLVAHLDDAVVTLFKRAQFMVDRLPPALKPNLGSSRRNEIVLDRLACTDGDIELRSLMAVASATGGEQWRSATFQLCHLSEYALFPRAEETLLGILQTVPPHPQSLVLIESTARGMGNSFQEEYDRAVAGESDFVPIFVPWHEVPEYRMAVPPDFELEPDERELKRLYHLTNEQLQWYRYALATQCGGDADKRAQEFPSSANEAFLVTGRPAFPVKVLREMAEAAHHIPLCRCVPHHSRTDGPPHCERGVLTEEGKFVRIAKGPLAVYRRPVPGHDYTLGADPSAGIEGGDPACIQVFDRNTGEFVATWHGFANPVAFAHLVATLAVWYNTAIVAPEVNNHGFTVVSELKNVIQYQRFYVWQRPDRIRNTFTNFYGWWSSYATRPILIDTFNFALADRDLVIYDPETISEALKFQWMTQVRAEGLGFDDRIFAAMIAYRVHIEMPLLSTGLPPRVRYAEFDKGTPPEGPKLSNFNEQVWAETDQAIQELQHGSQNLVDQYGTPEPREGDEEPAMGLDHVPDWEW